jgi:predicted kinase
VKDFFVPCPGPPDWRVPWGELEQYPWVEALAGCPQDPQHHAEGDVGVHARLVCEELAALPAWRALPEDERRIVFAATVLHDVGKPDCTRVEPDGRVSSRGHSRRGSILARALGWRLEVPFDAREQVCALIRHHQVPYFLVDRPDAVRLCLEVSQTARCDHLALLAEADVRGRVCADKQRLLDNVELFREFTREHGCLSGPRGFASDHARFLYFLHEGRHPDAPAHEEFTAEVVLLSGLPGSGKDHFVREHLAGWPVIALDDVRQELDVDPAEHQGEVVNRARDLARAYLRQRRSFVWNATNLSRQLRRGCVRLFADYGARVCIVYLEVTPEILAEQNRRRTAVVPEKVLARLLERWEIPDRTEAHEVRWEVRGGTL